MEIGIVTSLDSAESIDSGFDYIEGTVGSLLMPAESEGDFKKSLKELEKSDWSVPAVCCFIPGSIKSTGPDLDRDELLLWASKSFERAEQTGIEVIVYGSGGSRRIPDGFPQQEAQRQFIENLKHMGPVAQEHGVTIVIEPLNTGETNFINSVTEGAGIVKEVDHPSVRLLADVFHMAVDNEGPGSIDEYGYLLEHVHVAEKEGRAVPGKAEFDFVPYFKALKNAGYDRRISIECRWEDMGAENKSALDYLRGQLEQAGY